MAVKHDGSTAKISGGANDWNNSRYPKTKRITPIDAYRIPVHDGGSGGWLTPRHFLTVLHNIYPPDQVYKIEVAEGPTGKDNVTTVLLKDAVLYYDVDGAAYNQNFPDGKDYSGRAAAHDLVIIEVPTAIAKPEDLLTISKKAPAVGDTLNLSGYTGSAFKRYGSNIVTKILGGPNDGHTLVVERNYVKPTQSNVMAEGGDSGAPVLNQDGELVALVVRSSEPLADHLDNQTHMINLAGMLPAIEAVIRRALPDFRSAQYDDQNRPAAEPEQEDRPAAADEAQDADPSSAPYEKPVTRSATKAAGR